MSTSVGIGDRIGGVSVASVAHIAAVVVLENICYALGVLASLQIVHHLFKLPLLRSNYVIMALILSCFAKFATVPLFIWPDYSQHHSFATVITLFVMTSQLTALKVMAGGRSWLALTCVLSGLAGKFLMEYVLLS